MLKIEQWLDNMLREAEFFNVPVTIQEKNKLTSGKKKSPRQDGHYHYSTKYGIDRKTLIGSGISHEGINSLYLSLYVSTIGLLNTLKETVNQQSNIVKINAAFKHLLRGSSLDQAIKDEKGE